MGKYPALITVSTVVTIIGWIAVVIGGLGLFGGLVSVLSVSNNPFGALFGMYILMGSAQLALFGLVLAANGELIKVIVDIEENTSGRTSNAQVTLASAENAETASLAVNDTQTARTVPRGFQECQNRRLQVNERVFSLSLGEGVVVGPGRNRNFSRVRFDEGGMELEVEVFGLYHKV